VAVFHARQLQLRSAGDFDAKQFAGREGIGIVKVAKQVGLGVGTVAKLKGEMVANS
jgi:hypothetical protein